MKRLAHFSASLLFGARAGEWLSPVLSRYMPGLSAVLCVSLLSAALGLAPPYLTKLLIDTGLMAGDEGALLTWAGAIFAVGLTAVLLGAANSLLHLRFSARMLAEVRANVLDAVFRLPPERHAGLRVGEVMARLDGDAGEVQQFAFDALLSGLGALVRLVGGAVMLAVLDWRLALIAMALAPVELAFLAWARPETERLAETARERRGVMSGYLAESVAGLSPIKALGAEQNRGAGLAPLQTAQIAALMQQRLWQEWTGGVPTLFGAVVRTVVLVVGGLWVIRDGWPLGSLIAFLAYMGFLVGPMRTLLGLYHAQARVKVALRRLMDFVGEAEPGAGCAAAPGAGRIEIENLHFAHPGGPVLFEGLSLDIAPGTKMLLDGPSGSGKSGLIALLGRGLHPGKGCIRLDGMDVAELDPVGLRRAVQVVPQMGYLFNGTVAENLRLADPRASDEDLWRVLEIAQLAAWLRESGDGLETPVAERAQSFSGGQRQRLAVARALLVPFKVLILDESLSEVDGATARKLVAALDAAHPDRTRILVAHAGAERLGPFDQEVRLPADCRTARGDLSNQRVKAREKAV